MTHFAPLSGTPSGLLSQHMQVLEHFSSGIIWLDEKGEIIGVNDHFLQVLQLEKSAFEQKHKNICQLASNLHVADWKKIWERLLLQKSLSFHLPFTPEKNGTAQLLQLRGTLLQVGQLCVCCAIVEQVAADPILHHYGEASLQLNRIGHWQWDLESRTFAVSEIITQLLRMQTSQPKLRQSWLRNWLKKHLFPKEYIRVLDQLKYCLLQRVQTEVEFSLPASASGKERRFRCIAVPVQESGRIVKVWGTIQDITHLIERTEEMYLSKFCLDNVQEMVYWVDVNGNLKYANAEMGKVLGYTQEELLKMKLWELRADFKETRWQFQWEEFRKGKTLQLEVNFKHKDQREVPIHVTGYYLNFRGHEIACIFGKDLSGEKRREEILRLTRYSLNSRQEMVYWIRQDGSFYYFNDAFAARLGYTREEVQCKKLLDFFPGFTEEDFRSGWEKLYRNEINTNELQICHRNGFLIPVQAYVTLITVEGETCACGIVSDISERKQKEETLSTALAEIKRLQVQWELDNQILKNEIAEEYRFNNIISASAAYKKVLKKVEQAARADVSVLLTGEPGTGKELLAHALHQLSNRASRPLVKINCGIIPDHLLESTLFGHEKGAFPGAFQQKSGRFEMANGGTLFFNEIGDLSYHLQGKLLQVLQKGQIMRIGGNEPIDVDVRIVAASNRNLEQLVKLGLFRQDLYEQIQRFCIHNIPLRERREDIPLLAQYFVDKFALKAGKQFAPIAKELLESLQAYEFPGNVGELENILERAVILSKKDNLQLDHSFLTALSTTTIPTAFKSLAEVQREHILQALRATKGQITGENGAAKLLQLNDKTLYSKMKKLNIERFDYLQKNE